MADAPVQSLLNEAALKRVDPYAQQVIDVAKYVALYTFENNSWKKSEIEGSLFVYSRTAEPLYNILVLNRLNKNNLVEPITCQVDIQPKAPFLLYKNNRGSILGIWFFDKDECVRLTNLVQKLIKHSTNKASVSPVKEEENIDIFKMLTKAQEAYNEAKDNPQRNTTHPIPKDIMATPKSVADFFAKASGAPQTVVEYNSGPRHKTLSESDQNPGLLQQLMSNPVHSVEHIEKQQRSVTPQSVDTGATLTKTKSSETQRGAENIASVKIENGLSYLSSSPGFPVNSEENKLDLMPPAMFTPRTPVLSQPQQPEPLTRNQLLQALDYLLRNDADFMTKLHEAYVRSLTEKIF